MDTNSLWSAIEGIALDGVGSLIEPCPPVADAYCAAARRQGVILHRAEVRARFARHFHDDEADERLGLMATDEALEHRRWRRIVAAVLPEVPDADQTCAELWAHFARPDAWRCFPDVGPALRELRAAGLRLGIASNFDARLRAVVAGSPVLAGFEGALVISSEVGYRKPHPR